METILEDTIEIRDVTDTESEPNPSPDTVRIPRRRSSLRNILWNWLGVFADLGMALILTPFLIRQLGDETYGVWILIGAFSGYFGMLDLGIRGATGRFVALYAARDEHDLVQSVLSTASLTLSGLGLVAFAVIALVAYFLPVLYSIPAEQVTAAQWALAIVGAQLAFWFIFRVFDAALWARQRFDLLNIVDVPTAFVRAGLAWWFLTSGGGLLALAWISFGLAVANGLAKCLLTFWEIPRLQIRPSFAKWSMLRDLVGYGFWSFIISAMWMARTQGLPLVVGAFVGLRFLGPFSIIMRLPSTATTILTAATGVFTPVAVSLHAKQDHIRQRQLVIEGSRLSFSLGLYFAALFACLGGPLLSIWIRPDFAEYAPLLVLIGLGELLPMTMSIPQGVLQAMAKHQSLAWVVTMEAIVTLAASAALANWLGLWGVALSIALASSVFRGCLVMRNICKIIEVDLLQFARQTVLTPLLAGLPAVLLLYLAKRYHTPANWPELIAYSAGFSVMFAAALAYGVVGWQQTQVHCRSFLQTFGFREAEPNASNKVGE